jgi:dimethylamine monooxygenase subunit A
MAFDFDAAVSAPFRMQPGLRKLADGARQLTPARPGSRHQREKLAVLSAFAGQALLARPGFDPVPALAALARQAADEHPGTLEWDGRRASVAALGVAVQGDEVIAVGSGPFGLGDEAARCLRGLAPAWRLAGLLCLAFEEDFAVVSSQDASIPWLAVCLPSFWAPEEKVGRHFAEVHAPVADNTLLLRASAALTQTVSGPTRWERFVWTITDHPRLHAHPGRVDPDRWAGHPVARAWWRTERQTFIPLPERGEAVFTIHVEVSPLADAVAAPGRAARLHAALASMSPAVLDYRGLAGVRGPLLDWLASRP